MQRKFLGVFSVDFDAIGQLLIINCGLFKYLRRNGNKMKLFIRYLWNLRKLMIYLLNNLIEFDIPMNLVGLMKMSK